MTNRIGQVWEFEDDLFLVVAEPIRIDDSFWEHPLLSLTTSEQRFGLELRHLPWEDNWKRVQ